MKKAFSLAELMLTLVIMSVISAILIPTVMDIAPNNEKYLFQSAYKTLETVVNILIHDGTLYPAGNFNASDPYFCENFSKVVNIIGSPNCTLRNYPGPLTGSGEVNEPNVITTNGMMWWGLVDGFGEDYIPGCYSAQVFVDVNGTDGDGVLNEDIFRIQVCTNGKIVVNDENSQAEVESINMQWINKGDNSNALEYINDRGL